MIFITNEYSDRYVRKVSNTFGLVATLVYDYLS